MLAKVGQMELCYSLAISAKSVGIALANVHGLSRNNVSFLDMNADLVSWFCTTVLTCHLEVR
jgi:hypothetical protein